MLQVIKQFKGDPLETSINFRNKISQSLKVSKKNGKGTLLLWNGFLFHDRGFGCDQNEVIITCGKSA